LLVLTLGKSVCLFSAMMKRYKMVRTEISL
jgi:hypothetical protein